MMLDLRYDDRQRPSERGGRQDVALVQKSGAKLSVIELQVQNRILWARKAAITMRNFGFSEKNYYLLVPRTAQPGDEVWALLGGEVLYILRATDRQTRHFLIIVEACAHGLMDGDIVKRLQSGELETEDITLV